MIDEGQYCIDILNQIKAVKNSITTVEGKILKTLVIRKVKKGGFHEYMKSIGKFGGQNKIPRLSNSRDYLEELKSLN